MAGIVLHTMEYMGNPIAEEIILRNYIDCDYEEYKRIYEAAFHEMRVALQLQPYNCCDTKEELLSKRNDIYIYAENETLIGAIAIYENEIDDFVIDKAFQHKGYGKKILSFAVAYMQKKNIFPITLKVTDWNKRAITMYEQSGFVITKTETIDQKVKQ